MALTLGTEEASNIATGTNPPDVIGNIGTDRALEAIPSVAFGTVGKSAIVTASGTNPNEETADNFEGTDNVNIVEICALDDDTFAVLYYNLTDFAWYIRVGTRSGTSISWGAQQTSSIGASGAKGNANICAVSSTELLTVERASATTATLRLFSVSGTTITAQDNATVTAVTAVSGLSGLDIASNRNSKALVTCSAVDTNGDSETMTWGVDCASSTITSQSGAGLSAPGGIGNENSGKQYVTGVSSNYYLVAYGVSATSGGTNLGAYVTLVEVQSTNTATALATVQVGNGDTTERPAPLAALSDVVAIGLITYDGGGSDDEWRCYELTIDLGTPSITSTDWEILKANATATNQDYQGAGKMGDQKVFLLYDNWDGSDYDPLIRVVTTDVAPAADTGLWFTNDKMASVTNIGDATWTDPIGGAVVKPGTAYQTIWAMVGDDLWKTENGGTSWTNKATVGFECDPDGIVLLDGDIVSVTNRVSGGNRVALVDDTTVSYTDTGKTTTGGGTALRKAA